MKAYIYLDESGVPDKHHCDYFVYGGVLVAGRDAADNAARRYLGLERAIRSRSLAGFEGEVKASTLERRDRNKVFKSLSTMGVFRFAAVVDLRSTYDEIFISKRRKQCFFDYAAKRAVKHGLETAFAAGYVRKEDVTSIAVVVDEHSSSTMARYTLEEGIDEELRFGTFNCTWTKKFDPLFSSGFPKVKLAYVDSRCVPMVRAADITANWVYCAVRDMQKAPEVYGRLCSAIDILWLP